MPKTAASKSPKILDLPSHPLLQLFKRESFKAASAERLIQTVTSMAILDTPKAMRDKLFVVTRNIRGFWKDHTVISPNEYLATNVSHALLIINAKTVCSPSDFKMLGARLKLHLWPLAFSEKTFMYRKHKDSPDLTRIETAIAIVCDEGNENDEDERINNIRDLIVSIYKTFTEQHPITRTQDLVEPAFGVFAFNNLTTSNWCDSEVLLKPENVNLADLTSEEYVKSAPKSVKPNTMAATFTEATIPVTFTSDELELERRILEAVDRPIDKPELDEMVAETVQPIAPEPVAPVQPITNKQKIPMLKPSHNSHNTEFQEYKSDTGNFLFNRTPVNISLDSYTELMADREGMPLLYVISIGSGVAKYYLGQLLLFTQQKVLYLLSPLNRCPFGESLLVPMDTKLEDCFVTTLDYKTGETLNYPVVQTLSFDYSQDKWFNVSRKLRVDLSIV